MSSVILDRAVYVFLLGILVLNCFTVFGTEAQPLAQNECTFLEQLHSSLLCLTICCQDFVLGILLHFLLLFNRTNIL
jgi:hypothetical protein